jgi:hypothetical protein
MEFIEERVKERDRLDVEFPEPSLEVLRHAVWPCRRFATARRISRQSAGFCRARQTPRFARAWRRPCTRRGLKGCRPRAECRRTAT